MGRGVLALPRDTYRSWIMEYPVVQYTVQYSCRLGHVIMDNETKIEADLGTWKSKRGKAGGKKRDATDVRLHKATNAVVRIPGT